MPKFLPNHPWRVVLEALGIALLSALVGVSVNALRPEGIPFIQKEDYQIFAPCPETTGETQEILHSDPLLRHPDTMVVDGRSKEDYEKWHWPSARHVPFDYLEPVAEQHLSAILQSGKNRVVVYGDGQDPDSGRELAKELAGRGIRKVSYIKGGAPALRHPAAQEKAP